MTVHDLHDALNLLPSDLITAADQVRTAPKTKVIYWKRMLPIAACFVLLVGLGLMLRGEGLLGHMMKTESVPEAPAAMAPVPESQKVTADAAAPEAPAMDEPMMEAPAEEEAAAKAPTEAPKDAGSTANSAAMGGDEKAVEEELYIDHSHRYAEQPETVDDPVEGYCGNIVTTVYLNEGDFTLSGSDSVAITDILINLDYDPDQTCRCMAEFTVDTEMISGIQVNLMESFARCDKGQAALTEEQVMLIQNIIDTLR